MAPISTSQLAPSTLRSSPSLSTCSSQPRRPRYCIFDFEAVSTPPGAMHFSGSSEGQEGLEPLREGHCIHAHTDVNRDLQSGPRPEANGTATDPQDPGEDVAAQSAQVDGGDDGRAARAISRRIRSRQPA